MFKWYADTFAFDDNTISKRSLFLLILATVISIPVFPLLAWASLIGFPENYDLILIVTLVISFIGFVYVCFSKICNRFWARDKYLDEWELSLKREAMAFSAQLIAWIAAVGLLMIVLLQAMGFLEPENIILRSDHLFFGFLTVMLVILYSTHFYILAKLKPVDAEE